MWDSKSVKIKSVERLFCSTDLLLSLLFTGIGGACVYAGGYSAVASHFVGLAPFVAMSTSVSLGALTTPLIISKWLYIMNFE